MNADERFHNERKIDIENMLVQISFSAQAVRLNPIGVHRRLRTNLEAAL
jgi:hypothetical protein